MRRTSMPLLTLFLSPLFFYSLVSATTTPAPSHTPWLCAPKDPYCNPEKLAEAQRSYEAVFTKGGIDYTDVPFLDLESDLVRFDPGLSLYYATVHCWPSVGGIIIAKGVHPIELAYIGLDRFRKTPRSLNQTEEDVFCMQLRKIGGKWWDDYYDYAGAGKARRTWPDEREVLFLGWPEKGGVWVLRYEHRKTIGGDLGPVMNALNMEERCQALENHGAVFFENPEESEIVAPFLQGFGQREKRRDPEYEDGGMYDHSYE